MLEKILRPARIAIGCQLMILSSTPLVLQSVAAMTMKMIDLRRSKDEVIDISYDLIVLSSKLAEQFRLTYVIRFMKI